VDFLSYLDLVNQLLSGLAADVLKEELRVGLESRVTGSSSVRFQKYGKT